MAYLCFAVITLAIWGHYTPATPTATPAPVQTEAQKAEQTKKEIYDAVTKDMTPKQLANKAYVAKQVAELTKENADNEALLKQAGDYENWIKTKLTGFDMHSGQLVDYVKERLKDPDSLEVVQTTHENNIDKGYIIVDMKFRAKNSFNAVVPGDIKAKFVYNTDNVSIISFQS